MLGLARTLSRLDGALAALKMEDAVAAELRELAAGRPDRGAKRAGPLTRFDLQLRMAVAGRVGGLLRVWVSRSRPMPLTPGDMLWNATVAYHRYSREELTGLLARYFAVRHRGGTEVEAGAAAWAWWHGRLTIRLGVAPWVAREHAPPAMTASVGDRRVLIEVSQDPVEVLHLGCGFGNACQNLLTGTEREFAQENVLHPRIAVIYARELEADGAVGARIARQAVFVTDHEIAVLSNVKPDEAEPALRQAFGGFLDVWATELGIPHVKQLRDTTWYEAARLPTADDSRTRTLSRTVRLHSYGASSAISADVFAADVDALRTIPGHRTLPTDVDDVYEVWTPATATAATRPRADTVAGLLLAARNEIAVAHDLLTDTFADLDEREYAAEKLDVAEHTLRELAFLDGHAGAETVVLRAHYAVTRYLHAVTSAVVSQPDMIAPLGAEISDRLAEYLSTAPARELVLAEHSRELTRRPRSIPSWSGPSSPTRGWPSPWVQGTRSSCGRQAAPVSCPSCGTAGRCGSWTGRRSSSRCWSTPGSAPRS